MLERQQRLWQLAAARDAYPKFSDPTKDTPPGFNAHLGGFLEKHIRAEVIEGSRIERQELLMNQQRRNAHGMRIAVEHLAELTLGHKIEVPLVPQEGFSILDKAESEGITQLELVYLPPLDEKTLAQANRTQALARVEFMPRELPPSLRMLKGGWRVIDGRNRPDYNFPPGTEPMYENDENFIGKIAAEHRERGDIETREPWWGKSVSLTSRFRISHDDVNQFIIPDTEKLLDAPKGSVALPTVAEWLVEGVMYHPEWKGRDTAEWTSDTFYYKPHPTVSTEGTVAFMCGQPAYKEFTILPHFYVDASNYNIGFRLQTNLPQAA